MIKIYRYGEVSNDEIFARDNIAPNVADTVRENCGKKPYAIDGLRNSQWVAMDYGDILVHVFLPDVRTFYDIEHLWADAKITTIPDLD